MRRKSPHATQNVNMRHWVKGKYATWHGPHTGANESQSTYTLTHTPGCNLAPRNTCWCSRSSPLCNRTLHCLNKGHPSSGMGTSNLGPCTTPAASYKAKARPKHSHCHERMGISGERWTQCKKRKNLFLNCLNRCAIGMVFHKEVQQLKAKFLKQK